MSNTESVSERQPLTHLEKEFSPENFNAYARACEEIAVRLTEILEVENKGNIDILLPSRGALPIFMGACFGLKHLEMLENIELPPLKCFDYVWKKITGERKTKVLIFPFTADVNLNELVSSSDQQRQVVDGMRRFGAKAVLEFFKPPGERNGLEYQMFLAFLGLVEKREEMVEFYKNFPRIDRLVVIDTVISGRASWTILDEWEKGGKKIGAIEEGGKIEPILVVDAGGKKVRKKFGRYIYNCRGCYPIPRILTEDRGAALEGVVAVIYPELILAAHEKPAELYPWGYPLFGSWHAVPQRDQEIYLRIFNGFLKTIEAIIEGGDVEVQRKDFLQHLSVSGVLSERNTSINGKDLNPHYRIARVEKTSAHVVQIYHDREIVSDIIRKIAREVESF